MEHASEKPKKIVRHTAPCQHEGCEKWAWARGYCDSHYQKLKRKGVLQPIRRNIGDLVKRFHNSYTINPTTGCWEWHTWLHPDGYAILVVGAASKKIRAHRYSYELHTGSIPAGLMVCHRCDNRKCVNPFHLFVGTGKANMQDMVIKGRHGAQTGAIRPKITPKMAMNIRVMFARSGYSMKALSLIYGVDHSTISNIVNGRRHLFVG